MWVRLILGTLFVSMAVGKLVSWPHLPEIFGAYQLPGTGTHAFAAVLIGAELVGGGWLLARPRSHAMSPVLIYAAVAVLWAGLGLQAILRGIDIDNCGCFGIYLTQRLSWFVLAQDALLLLYAYLMVRGSVRARRAAAPTSSPAPLTPAAPAPD